jgi:hypothetical protein
MNQGRSYFDGGKLSASQVSNHNKLIPFSHMFPANINSGEEILCGFRVN